jgi:hypothetical protein
MTLAHIDQNQAVEYQGHYVPADPTGGRLVAWAEGLSAAHRIGSALCETAFCPQHFKGKPGDAAAAILFGDEIGFTPTQSLRSIFVISGTPGLYARAMVALVLAHGHEVWTDASTDDAVTVCGKRAGTNRAEKVTWTTARARKAGYTSNKKYESDPQGMLYARAAAEVCRKIAPDALAGVAFSVEELELNDGPAPVKRTAQRQTTAPAKVTATVVPNEPAGEIPEPDFDQPDIEAVDPEKITAAQLTKLHTVLTKIGRGDDRDWALNEYDRIIGHPVTSSKELTKAEAMRVIDALEQAEPPADVEQDALIP